jgi:hypothetical protein
MRRSNSPKRASLRSANFSEAGNEQTLNCPGYSIIGNPA